MPRVAIWIDEKGDVSWWDKKPIAEQEIRVRVLEEKVETIENLNSKLLNTIYWTLGTVAAIFTAIITLNFFSNFSINQRKIENIKEELDNNLKEANQQQWINQYISYLNNFSPASGTWKMYGFILFSV